MTALLHSCLGEDCWGCLIVDVRGKHACIVCNGCNYLIGTVPTAEISRALSELAGSQPIRTAQCTHCGASNLFRGFPADEPLICAACGEHVVITDGSQVPELRVSCLVTHN
jgi:hypothetical protein